MSATFLPIMAVHLSTVALGGLYVYRRGATPLRLTVLGGWTLLFFPVAYNVVKVLNV